MMQKIDIEEFENLFREHYPFLCLVSFQVIKDNDISKDVVQDFFIYIWQNREQIQIKSSFKSYAYKAVKNLSLQQLEKIKKSISFIDQSVADNSDYVNDLENTKQAKNLKIKELIEKLPEARKEIFLSYVIDGLSYAEIAQKNAISINTVKTQMKRAYSFLKENSSNDIIIIIFLLQLKL